MEAESEVQGHLELYRKFQARLEDETLYKKLNADGMVREGILGGIANTKEYLRAGEMAQWLRALAALPEVLSSIPNNHMVVHNHL